MDIKPGEITDILKREIRDYDREIDVARPPPQEPGRSIPWRTHRRSGQPGPERLPSTARPLARRWRVKLK